MEKVQERERENIQLKSELQEMHQASTNITTESIAKLEDHNRDLRNMLRGRDIEISTITAQKDKTAEDFMKLQVQMRDCSTAITTYSRRSKR